MDSVAQLNKKIAGYLEQLNMKQKKAVLSVVKTFAEENLENSGIDEESFKEIDKRIKELESGKVKGYSWEEVKQITRQSVAEMKRK